MLRVDEEDDPASSERVGLATRGSPSRLRASREPGPVKKATWSRSSPKDTLRGAVREHGSDVGVVRAFPWARTASGSLITVSSSGRCAVRIMGRTYRREAARPAST